MPHNTTGRTTPPDQESIASRQDLNEGERGWLEVARNAWESSTSFVDTNYRRKWEDSLRHFHSEHHSGSKFNSALYQYRSKMFRPKSRAMVRSGEAACAAAFFANRDVVDISPASEGNVLQRISADVMMELLTYRLQKTIPWFLTCIGAYQDTKVIGVCCSKQHWVVETRKDVGRDPVLDDAGKPVMDEFGLPVTKEVPVQVRTKDEPAIDLFPVEHLRIHPAADWRNPVKSSPYLIHMVPMYVQDVRAKMLQPDPDNEGKTVWRPVDDAGLLAATRHTYDTTRAAREGGREEKYDQSTEARSLSDFDIVWVHENIVKRDGQDWVYHTLSSEYLLSWEPKPIKEVYFHGERPYVMGFCVLETHKIFPPGDVGLAENLQREINESVNQRLDNVSFVLNKRYLVNRGGQIDLATLLRNVAGSITLVNDVDKDVRELEYNDITGSAFQEQDRMYAEFDELTGSFSTSSVMGNRELNETVGGMAMLRSGAGTMTEYGLRLFAETWAEPVLCQMVRLEQEYETDMVMLTLAAEKAGIVQKYGVDQITDEMLNQQLTTTVNVGFGATDPLQKVNKFAMGIKIVLESLASAPPGTVNLNYMEIAKEVFGLLGFKASERFFMQIAGIDSKDPEKQQMAAIIQNLQALAQDMKSQLEDKQGERLVKLEAARIKEEGQDRRKAADIQVRTLEKEYDLLNPVAGESKPLPGGKGQGALREMRA